jgi:phosphoglycerol transferase MdoB-like AlkP superfamily enzyme
MPQILLTIVLVLFIILGIGHYPMGKAVMRVTPKNAFWVFVIVVFIGRHFMNQKLDDFYPLLSDPELPGAALGFEIRRSFRAKATAKLINGSEPRRNYILLDSESFESGFIGKLNPYWPKSMPYISSLLDNCSWFSNVQSQPYTTWSAAGCHVQECGFPLVLPNVIWKYRGQENYGSYSSLPCLATFLGQVGYKLYAVATATLNVMGMESFLQSKGYHTIAGPEIKKETDRDVMNWMIEDLIPNTLMKEQPFVLMFISDGTHPWPHFTIEESPYIQMLKDEKYPIAMRAFTSYDENLCRFIGALENLGLKNNTELAIASDHLIMHSDRGLKDVDRNLTIIFPWRKQDSAWKRAQGKTLSLYDLTPTVLRLLGVEYSPPFPWGADVFAKESGKVPTTADLKTIYSIITGDSRARGVMCKNKTGFCTGNEH